MILIFLPLIAVVCFPQALAKAGRFLTLGSFVCGLTLFAASEAGPSVLSAPTQVWSLHSSERLKSHPIHMEGIVAYYDPSWRLFWLMQGDTASYLLLGAEAPNLRAGQRVLIEGTLVPDRGLEKDLVRITVLEDKANIDYFSAQGRLNETEALDSRCVVVTGYVDTQQDIDAHHLRLNMIVDGRPLVGWIDPRDHAYLPDLQGRVIKARGLYSRRFIPSKNFAYLELWIGDESNVEVLHALPQSPRFQKPRVSLGSLYRLASGSELVVEAQVLEQDFGRSLTLRDSTGQLVAYTAQKALFPKGCTVLVSGRVMHRQGECVLEDALALEQSGSGSSSSALPGSLAYLRRVPLSGATTGAAHVHATGVVSWSFPDQDVFFLQDMTGGMRVHFDRSQMSAPSLVKHLRVEAELMPGRFGNELRLLSFEDLGALNSPTPPLVSHEQALSGRYDAQWISMRGFLRRVVSDGDWRWIHLTTPSGDFIAHLNSPVNFVANEGALVRIQGICEVIADPSGEPSRVVLRVPFLHDLQLEKDAPLDPFDLPLQPLSALPTLALDGSYQRVRVRGTVSYQRPGHLLCLQSEDAGVVILGSSLPSASLGTELEAVGILGREGGRTVLREAFCRNLGEGPVPEPVHTDELPFPLERYDAMRVIATGVLVDVSPRSDRIQLSVQRGTDLFDVHLTCEPGSVPPPLPSLGSEISVSGVCRLLRDEAGRLRGFLLLPNSAADIQVLKSPRLLTLPRALILVGLLTGALLLAISWVTALRRQVQRQTAELRLQMQHQQRLEAGVQHAVRLESLGLMAGGLAHDFNNLLTVIMGNLGLAMVNPEGLRAVGDHLKEALKGAMRARDLTQQLLTFARGGDPVREALALAPLAIETVQSTLQGSQVSCRFELPEGIPAVSVDPKQLRIVLGHLVQNAVQAMEGEGRLEVTAATHTLTLSNCRQGLVPGTYVCLSIRDFGPGISTELQSRIFDPYFSTKKGASGLGLATAYSVVRRHGGLLELHSESGKGATFEIWLPIAPESALTQAQSAITEYSDAGLKGRRVLLMDDEESIRRIVSLILRRQGMDVVCVADGERALEHFRTASVQGHPFDLIILDLTIPGGLGGRATIEEIRRSDSRTPAIVSSGYSSDPVLANYKAYGFDAMVPKPYEVEDLLREVHRLVRSPRGN